MTRTVELPGGRRATYEVVGSGEPALMLAGGPGLAAAYMRSTAELFADTWQSYLIDPHGSGGSTPPDDPAQYSPEGHVVFYDEVRLALGLGPLTVVGHSFGATTALTYAALLPDAVTRAVALAPFGVGTDLDEDGGGDAAQAMEAAISRHSASPWYPAARDAWDNWTERVLATDDPAVVDEIFSAALPLYFAYPDRPEIARAIDALRGDMRSDLAATKAWENGLYQTIDLRPLLPRIQAPTLVVAGELDLICGPAQARPIAAAIDGATLRPDPRVRPLAVGRDAGRASRDRRQLARRERPVARPAVPRRRRHPRGSTLQPDDVLDVVEQGLRAHGLGEVVMPPKDHLSVEEQFQGHFNILKAYVPAFGFAGVKVIGDYVNNYRHDLPSELALLTLYRAETGTPVAIMDATELTWMRTGAVTAVGAKHLARPGSRVLGHIGARGTAWYNLRYLDHLFGFDEIRVTSRRPESRERFAAEMSETLGKTRCRNRRRGVGSGRTRTSSSTPRGCPRSGRSSRTAGSSPARWSCPTARCARPIRRCRWSPTGSSSTTGVRRPAPSTATTTR